VSPELSVSVDLDGIHHHLRGYGIPAERSAPFPIWERAVPRFLELFARLGLRATFFVIAEDARDQAAALRGMARAGHEIGSHSLTHALPFAGLAPAALEREVRGSREALEAALGAPVRGFRAPGWSVSHAVIAAVEKAGYAYDSSIFPSPAYVAALLSMRRRLGGAVKVDLADSLRFAFSRRGPYRLGGLWEIPVTVTRWLRIPYYNTLDAVLGARVFDRLGASFARRGEPVHFALHGVDLLEHAEIDPRLHGHPGAARDAASKAARAEETLARLLRTHRPVVLGERYGAGAA
jgi:hypothetical protein